MAQGITISALDPDDYGPCPHDPGMLRGAAFDPFHPFDPAKGPLSAFNKKMLTTHGANPPTIHGFNCPDPANSGGGVFFCEFQHYNSQGQATMQWTSGFGNPSSGLTFFGTCNQYDWVTVDLQVSNDYGTTQESAGFVCPTGPNP